MVRDIFLKRTLKVIQNVEKFLKRPDEKYLHELRTESRKLEALFITLGELSGNNDYKVYLRKLKQFIKLFSPSRETDVCINMTNEYLNNTGTENPILQKFYENLKTLSVQQRKQIFVSKKLINFLLSKSSLEDYVKNKMFCSSEEVSTEKVSRFLGIQVGYLYDKMMINKEEVLSSSENKEQLHKMRLRAKPLRYTLDLINEVIGLPLSERGMKIKNMVALAGEIHDYDMLIVKAEEFKDIVINNQIELTEEIVACMDVFIEHLNKNRKKDYLNFKSLVSEIDSEKDTQGFVIL